jgi:1,4-dihydroxy-6-naphthoate synthase
MDRDVMNNHIKLFVNEFTSELGQEGRRAIIKLYEIAQEEKVIPEMPERIFLTS